MMKHILVVDDNKANLTIAKNVLEESYTVTPVLSGEQALKFLEKKRPDLILLDIMMPGMDGVETMLNIRRHAEWSDIPVIFLTGSSSAKKETECIELGADEFIAKPFVTAVLKKRIANILELDGFRKKYGTPDAEE